MAIARGVSGSTGETLFRDLARHLCVAVGADAAILGRLVGPEKKQIETVAVQADGEPRRNFAYDRAGAPCEKATSFASR